MKKFYFFILLFFMSQNNILFASDEGTSYPACENYYDSMEKYLNQTKKYKDLLERVTNVNSYNTYYKTYTDYYDKYKDSSDSYIDCINEEDDKFIEYFNKGYSYYNYGSYKDAVEYFEKALGVIPTDSTTKNNLGLSYYYLGSGTFDKEDYENTILYYNKALDYGYGDKYTVYFNIGVAYYILGEINESIKYYNKALDETYDSERIQNVKDRIALVNEITIENEKYEEAKKNAPSNDTYSYMQYYLNQLNISLAKKSVTNNYEVVVAVIDDGININHPDLTGNIWVNKKEIAGNGIDDDNNGYVDDYNGWNFVYDNNNLLPLGSHGTLVSGIIGAESYNSEGIMGIANNVKLMPVGVCDEDGCNLEYITKGIQYAVDNGANIINLSLGGSQFTGYNKLYDEALEYAFDNGVIVVVAAGNGDILSNQEEGVNTSVNKISPVCNYGDSYKNIIGVGAFTEDGYRANWSNYDKGEGGCVDFYAPGENIFSTSVNAFDGVNYLANSGTSFSAPIVSGIVALGYNQYGKIDNDIVWDALNNSLVLNDVGNHIIDAKKYLEYLSSYIKNQKEKEVLNTKADLITEKISSKYSGYSNSKKIVIFNKYVNLLTQYNNSVSSENLNYVILRVIDGLNSKISNLK